MVDMISFLQQMVIHAPVSVVGVRIIFYRPDQVDYFSVRHGHVGLHWCEAGFTTAFPVNNRPVIVRMLTATGNAKRYIPFHSLSYILHHDLFLLLKANFFFSRSSLSLPSNSFSAMICLSMAFSFSNRLISFNCPGVIP